MTALNKQALRDSALDMIRVLGYIASFESEDIDGDDLELRFETEDGFDTGCTISITSQCQDASDVMQQLLNELEAAEKRIAELRDWNAGLAQESFTYQQKVAELESRTVVVKQFDDFKIVHYGGSEDYAKGYIDCQNNYNKALIAAGIGVKEE